MADFNPDQYLSEKTAAAAPASDFDPDAYLKAKASPETSETPDEMIAKNAKALGESGDAANNALLDTLTLGYLPQIKAKAKQILAGEGIANDKNYIARRDEEIASQKELAEKYPVANAEGRVGGFVAPMLVTGGGSALAEGAEALPEAAAITKGAIAKAVALKTLKGAAVGGAIGAAQNPGDQEGETDPFQIAARLQNAKVGAAIGGPLSGALESAPAVANYLDQYANRKVVKAAGAMLKDFREMYGKDTIDETGQFIFDNKLAQPGDTYESIAEKASTLRNQTGQELGSGYDAASKIIDRLGPKARAEVDGAGFNPVRDKGAIMAAAKKDLGYAYGRKNALGALSNYLDELAEEHGNRTLNPQETNEIKTALDQTAINWKRNPQLREPDSETALKSLRTYIGTQIQGQIGTIGNLIGNPEAAENLVALNQKYGKAAAVASIAGDRAMRDSANAAFGLKEYAGGEIGREIGREVGGFPGAVVGQGVGMVAGKAGRTFGPTILPNVAKGAAKVAARVEPGTVINPGIFRAAAQANEPEADETPAAPLKGESKWAQDGFQNLIQHAGDDSKSIEGLKDQLMSTPQGRKLLISASDLKPGSKAMDNLMTQVKSQFGGEK